MRRIRCVPTASVNAAFLLAQLRDDVVDRTARRWDGQWGRVARTRVAAHRIRVDVVAQPQEHRGAQMIVIGRALEAHFGDGPRLDPGRRPVPLRLLGEGPRLALQRVQARLDLRQRALVEARADVRRVAQLPLVPVADEDGAERGPRALPLRVAADHEIGAARRFHLEPRRRAAACLVPAFLALADHAFEAAGQRRRVQRDAIFRGVHELDERRRQQALRKIAAPIAVTRAAQIDPREMQQIEGDEDHGRVAISHSNVALRLQLRPFLQHSEGWLAARVERHDLAVQDHAGRRPASRVPRRARGKLRTDEAAPSPRTKPDAGRAKVCEHPIAVELRFPHPVRAIEGRVARFGMHRLELVGHGLDLARRGELHGGNAIHAEELELPNRLAGEDREVLRSDIDGRREPVLVLDEKPLVLFLRAHQGERAFELCAAQQDAQFALLQALPDLALGLRAIVEPRRATFVGRIDAAVPDDHFARAVLPGWNHAFERGVVVRMVLDMHGKPLFVGIERRTLGHGQGQQDAVAFEPEVVVQSRGGMQLDDEQQRPTPGSGYRRRRLGRGREGPLGGIFG